MFADSLLISTESRGRSPLQKRSLIRLRTTVFWLATLEGQDPGWSLQLTPQYVVPMIRIPRSYVRVTRTGADGVKRIAFIGYVAEWVPDDASKTVEVKARAPESLILDDVIVPFPPPLEEHVAEPQVFEFWWKQLHYVFGLPNPRKFPPLTDMLSPDERVTVERYVYVAAELAGSGLLNALQEGFNVRLPEGTYGPEEVVRDFSRTDLQVGFAGLLRQCDSTKERASFHRVMGILTRKADAVHDDAREMRLAHLKAWRDAAKKLRLKSLNQLIRDKLVADEGLLAFAYNEEHSPGYLLSLYSYGELIHWDSDKSAVVAEFGRDPYIESDRRLAYLDAASGLAHLYMGFAELARAAVGPVPTPKR